MPTIRLVRPGGVAPAGEDGAGSSSAPAGDGVAALTPMSGSESPSSEESEADEYVVDGSAASGEAAKRKRARSGFRQAQDQAQAPRKVTLRLGKRPANGDGEANGAGGDSPASGSSARKRRRVEPSAAAGRSGHASTDSESGSDIDTAQDYETTPSRSASPEGFAPAPHSAPHVHHAGAGSAGRMVELRGSKFLTKLLRSSKAQNGEHVGSAVKDLGGLALKVDHQSRPLWIDGDGKIILEGFSPIAEQAQDFLIAIAEPVSRPSFIHEYALSEYSLYAAMSVGLETNDIIEVLGRLSKTPLPQRLVRDIRRWTSSYGKLKLVLKRNTYTLESSSSEIILKCLEDEVISKCRVRPEEGGGDAAGAGGERRMGTGPDGMAAGASTGVGIGPDGVEIEARTRPREAGDMISAVIGIDRTDELDDDETVQSFEIDSSKIEEVKKRCTDIGVPVLEEYDFRQDNLNANLEIDLKPMTVIRPYQETSLSKMFGNGRARSGIIVLPCGAGKTLVGITAACTIKKSTLVLCTSAVSVAQWRQQFLQFSNISERQICVFTSQEHDFFAGAEKGAAGIVISTYSMVSNSGVRSHHSKKFMDFLRSREWGFLLLDEVHVAPANQFRQCVSGMKTHAKLGLTATLVREDEKIGDLNYLIGPKLYEANWMDLAKKGHIANVQCAEVWCPMTPEFYREYLRLETSRKRLLLHAMNPNKFQACQFLINYHEARGDKVIVFSDNVYALMQYAQKLGKAAIYGDTAEIERIRILARFQMDPNMNTIFLSKVGDTSIDLPEATCLIQISAHYGSRRQEAQRLGRILRAKRRNDEGFNAFFYSLVSTDTQEMYFSAKRQGFLIDQGYSFKVISQLQGIQDMPGLVFPTKDSQIELLQNVLLQGEDKADMIGASAFEASMKKVKKGLLANAPAPSPTSGVIRNVGSMTALSGAQHMSYHEQGKTLNKQITKEARKKDGGGGRHAFFSKRENEIKKARKAAQ